MVESLDFEPEKMPQAQIALPGLKATPTKKMTIAQTSQASKPSSVHSVEAGRKKQKAASKYSRLSFSSSTLIPLNFEFGIILSFVINASSY